MIYKFDNFQIDATHRILQRDGEPLALNPKAFDLLLTLIEKRGEILSKNELLEKVWENQFVEENNLTVHISALRKALGEKRNENRFLVTVPGKGYKFVGELNDANNTNGEIFIEKHSFSRIIFDEEIEDDCNKRQVLPIGELTANGNLSGKTLSFTPPDFVESNRYSGVWKRSLIILCGVGLLSAIIGSGYFWQQPARTHYAGGVTFAQPKIKQLTTNGKVAIAALAPDGKTFAYIVNDFGMRSLWLGFVDGGNHLLLRPAAEDARYFNLAFAPDGNRLYYS